MSEFLKRALRLSANGYAVLPVKGGEKRPLIEGWQDITFDEKLLRHYAERGYKNGNIGINTRNTPAVDLDIYDDELAQELENWMEHEFAPMLVRVGQAPKRLIVFRTDTPFRKLFCTYEGNGTKHKVEILGAGQQFVAYGVHPDTGRDYVWTSLDSPLDTPVADLPVMTPEIAERILDQFESMCELRGWRKVGRSNARMAAGEGETDEFDRLKPVLAITREKMLDTLDLIPNENADYDDYLTVGAALHHQTGGGADGLEMWHEWAAKSGKYEPTDVNRRWESFGHGPATVTFATLLYRAAKTEEEETEKAFERALVQVNLAPNRKELLGPILADLAKNCPGDLQMDIACKRVQDRIQELTDTKPRLETVRKLFNAAKPKTDLSKHDLPSWCENWVFITSRGEFFNTHNGQRLTRNNFDSAFGRFLLDANMRAAGEINGGKASDAALNLYQIPQVYDCVYLPGAGDFLTLNRNHYVNTFSEQSLPQAKKASTKDEHLAIKTVHDHFRLLFPDDRECNLLLDYLSYNIKYMDEKITWAVLIQGVEGAGKTWFSHLMSACIGGENIRNLPGVGLKENFTSWAEGRKMVFIEEVRLHDSNKFEVLDKLKPYISNADASIRRMRTDAYETPNITNYILFTNYGDALPISEADRRYMVLRTVFLTDSHIKLFNAQNPDYFANLFNTLAFHGDVIRQWFLDRDVSDEFNAKGQAPHTEAKDMMRDAANADDNLITLEAALLAGDPEISNEVLNARKLRESGHLAMLPSRTFGQLLAKAGFVAIGRYRLNGHGTENDYYYTRRSELFAGSGKLEIVRRLLAPPDEFDDGFN